MRYFPKKIGKADVCRFYECERELAEDVYNTALLLLGFSTATAATLWQSITPDMKKMAAPKKTFKFALSTGVDW